MKKALNMLLMVIHRLEDSILVGLLLTMIGLAVSQIVLRNLFDTGITWADSLLRVLVLWIALIGALVATRQQQHINIDLISRFLPVSAKRFVSAIVALFSAAVCAMLAYYCFDFVKMEYEAPSMAFANVPTWWCESIMPIGFALMAIRF
ncbi:MAG TPA: TRAP transporter small permease, partial [Agitococcus sp.]|nr:TRAP transporter small permease [Agitococcus sp.]